MLHLVVRSLATRWLFVAEPANLPGRSRGVFVATSSAQELSFRVGICRLWNKRYQVLMKTDVLLGWEALQSSAKAALPRCRLMAASPPLAPLALSPSLAGREAGLLPGYNYREGALPKPRCVWSPSCWEGHLMRVGSSWVAEAALPPTGSGESRLPLPARLWLCCR